jgi:putative transposase
MYDHLELEANGYTCSTNDLFNVLLGVASNQGTIESVCGDLVGTPDPQTIRNYINEQITIEELPQLEEGLRFTLGIRFVLPEYTISGVVQLLHKRVQSLGIQIDRLWLDRGFAQKEVHDYLSKEKIPALIACPIRGRRGGTRALCRGRSRNRTTYTFNKSNKDKKYTAELVVFRVFVTHKRTKKRRAMWWLFMSVNLELDPRQVRRLYRRRFGIETSYRCAGKVRGWTTSRNAAYRFLLMGLGLFLLNVWVVLRWRFTQIPRRGGRLLNAPLFQLKRFAKFIWQALERLYGYVQFITAIAPPLMS